jgi:hypothetical protein
MADGKAGYGMKYAIEYHIALAAKAYIESKVDAVDFQTWPVVTWFDPMAIDEGNRVVCICESVSSAPESPGNLTATVEIGVRSSWAQPTVDLDMAAHFSRVNQVRDVFNAPQSNLIADISNLCESGVVVSYVNQAREYRTEVNEGNYYSSLMLTIKCVATEE